MSGNTLNSRLRKNISVGVFLAGSGAVMALTGSGNAYADEPPPPFPVVEEAPPADVPLEGSDPSGDVEEAAVAPPTPVINTIVETARKQVGTGRTSPFYAQGAHEAWCADFVSWVLKESGVPVGGIGGWRNPSVWGLQSSLQSRGEFRGRNYTPQPGDVVIYGGSHTNLVVDVKGDNITTIGGNEGTRGPNVRTVSRHSGNITGFGTTGENGIRPEVVVPPAPEEEGLNIAPPPEDMPPPPMEELPPPPPPEPWGVPAEWSAPVPPPAEESAPLPPPEDMPPVEELPAPPPVGVPVAWDAPAPPPEELPPPPEELPPPPAEELPPGVGDLPPREGLPT